MKKQNLVMDVDETPKPLAWVILALQHVFAMFGATILVPILVNNIAGAEVLTIPVALISSGIGTLIYIFITKRKSPVYLGSSFAFITPMAVGFAKAGIEGVFPAIIAVGLVYVIFATLIKLLGKGWIDKLLPPVIIGPMIMIIGLGLSPTAVNQIGLTEGTDIIWQNLVIVLITFLTTSLIALRGKGFLKIIPFLTGIVSGYITAALLGVVDFTPVKDAAFFSWPAFQVPFLTYTPNWKALTIILPVALVTIAEHIGDHTALGIIINKNLLKDPGLERTLLGDGVASITAGLIGGPSNTTYGENTSVVGMSKVASVNVIILAAFIAIGFGFLGKLTALFGTIPNTVLGGVSLLLYGFIAVNGLKVLIQNQIDFNKIRNIIIAATMLVIGLGGAALSITTKNSSITLSGMSLAAIIGILLNLLLPEERLL